MIVRGNETDGGMPKLAEQRKVNETESEETETESINFFLENDRYRLKRINKINAVDGCLGAVQTCRDWLMEIGSSVSELIDFRKKINRRRRFLKEKHEKKPFFLVVAPSDSQKFPACRRGKSEMFSKNFAQNIKFPI